MIKRNLKNTLAFLVWGIMFIPLITILFPIKTEPLNGVQELPPYPAFTFKSWSDETFQRGIGFWFSCKLSIRNESVRWINQINYWLNIQPGNVVIGKDNELMGKEYINSFYGNDFLGETKLDSVFNELKIFRDSLTANGKELLVCFTPSKTRLYPEKIPSVFLSEKNKNTNYEILDNKLSKSDIPFVNFQKYCEQKEANFQYPIFSNLGVHWSMYSAVIFTDSIHKTISNLLRKKLTKVALTKTVASSTAYHTDDDLGKLLNLKFPLSLRDSLGYTEVKFYPDNADFKPKVSVIADSYFWNCIYSQIPKNTFNSQSAYLYYGKKFYNMSGQEFQLSNTEIKNFVKQSDLIIIMYTEPNLVKLYNEELLIY